MQTKIALAALALSCLSAHASLSTYRLEYSGTPFGNASTAVGRVILDNAILPNEPLNFFGRSGDALGVLAFELTLVGAASGNGAFDQSDLGADGGRWVWTLASACC